MAEHPILWKWDNLDTVARITESFERQAFMKTIGAKLYSIKEGQVIISVELKTNMMQQHGFGHAGITFSIGDTAAGYAALSEMQEDHEVLTSEMKIHLLSPADGKILKAIGSVLKPGRKLIVVKSDIYSVNNGRNKLIATMLGTMVPSIVNN